MIDPSRALGLAGAIRDLYAGAETEALERVARRLARGIDRPGWAEAKAAELGALTRELDGIIARLQVEGPALLTSLLQQAYGVGGAAADATLGQASFTQVNSFGVEALVRARLGLLEQLQLPILRNALDTYRAVVAELSGPALAGAATRRQAAAAVLQRFADAGVSGFVDSAGRSWDLASYAEMTTRTGIGQAHVQGHLDALSARGHDLVIVSDSPDECRICRRWEGKVLSISGTDARQPSVASARAAGLFHPNCSHSLGAYVEGLTRRFRSTANPLGEAERARQRELERQIRMWKRRQVAAAELDPDAAATAARYVQARQAELRTFIEDTGRRRDYAREGLGAR